MMVSESVHLWPVVPPTLVHFGPVAPPTPWFISGSRFLHTGTLLACSSSYTLLQYVVVSPIYKG